MAPGEVVNANKEKLGRAEALKLAKAAGKVIVAKGKKTVTFNMAKDPPDDKKLLSAILGPSGTLRAPTIRRGKTLLVGFNADVFNETLG